ncbi:MAG TPA: protein kinase [Acidobacteriota bacterium]|nr:protein kinase [Acidobacteriota bacterium]
MDSGEGATRSAQDWQKLWDIFHQARELNPAERANFLNHLEIADRQFRTEVEELLAAEISDSQSFENLINDELILLEENDSSSSYSINPDTVLVGRFRILRELGRGGMGAVYEAMDQELEAKVALKIMQSNLISDSAARERFHREINLARKVTHPNACRIFDLFQHGDLLFLTMELLPGETLQQKIKRDGPLDLLSTISIVLQILEPLSEMHRIGIVHRDLKASNIILVPNGSKVRAVLTDFGLAVGLSGSDSFEVTQTGQVLGTPQYMAPEQLKKEAITPATDIYALGLVLYEMLTGELPYKGESPLTIAAKRISEDAPSPRLLLPLLDRKWEQIILRCLERNPKNRFQSAADVSNAITGKALSTWIPIFASRHRIRITIAFLILLAALTGLYWKSKKAPQISGTDVISKRIWTGATGTPAGAISTDGKVLIDIDWAKANVMSIDLKTKKKSLLTKSNTWFHPYDFINHPVVTLLSADSKTVAYSIGIDLGIGSELRSINKSGQLSTMFRTNEAWITPHDWSHDGKHIVAHLLHKDGSVDIVLLSTKDETIRKLKTLDSTDIRKISFSPDSQHIAYDFPQNTNSFNHDLFLIALRSGVETRIVNHPANDYLLGWSPDNTRILFASDRSATNDAWSLRLVNGKPEGTPELIRKDIGQIFPLRITKQGSLYYAHLMSAVDVYTANLNEPTSLPSRIAQGDVGFSRSPAYSHDGNFLIFQSLSDPLSSRWRTGNQVPLSLKIISLQSGEIRQVVPDIKSSSGKTRWCADEQSVILRGDNANPGPGLYTVDLTTGKSLRLVEDLSSNYVRQYHVAPDGRSIFYLMNKDGSIMQKEIVSGKVKKICDDAADFDLSFDGRLLAVMATDIYKGHSTLRIVPIEGGRGDTILKLPMPEWISSLAWMPDGKSLIFSQGRRDLIDAPHRLWKISKAGGRRQDLGISSEYVTDLRLHPDGKQIAISTVTDSSEVWVMENFLNTN